MRNFQKAQIAWIGMLVLSLAFANCREATEAETDNGAALTVELDGGKEIISDSLDTKPRELHPILVR